MNLEKERNRVEAHMEELQAKRSEAEATLRDQVEVFRVNCRG